MEYAFNLFLEAYELLKIPLPEAPICLSVCLIVCLSAHPNGCLSVNTLIPFAFHTKGHSEKEEEAKDDIEINHDHYDSSPMEMC